MATHQDYLTIIRNIGPSRNYHRHLKPNFYYTDGIKFIADKFNCYWIINCIESFSETVQAFTKENINTDKLISETFDAIVISDANKAELNIIAIGYNDDELEETQTVIAKQSFEYTDLPQGEYHFFLTCQNDNNLILCLLKEM